MTNEVAKVEQNNELALDQERATRRTYCSVKADTIEDKKRLFQASLKCDELLNNVVGQVIAVKDVLIQETDVVENGEPRLKTRTILFDANGKTYVTPSIYFYNSIKNMMNFLGNPTEWNEPVEIKITKLDLGDGKKPLSFELCLDSSADS